MTLTPATRSLEVVLRNALAPTDTLRVLVATYDTTPSADPRYANVVLDGQALTIPNLNAVPAGTPGAAVYVLADNSRMWVLGAVTATGPTASGPAFIAKPGPPASTDGRNGDTYLDTSSLRIYGPKASGAWPAALARIMPLAPTYAQLKSG